ncbi:hypothetical protein [Acetobacterium bakii]|uniref:hypothetical protein n=1 Tax=Acetobacterium bakii TaxID=52689 RepID=UPI001364DABE|nr:hypothetical protein [Acetobacterium bakii]
MFDLETNVRSWSDYLRGRGNLTEIDFLKIEKFQTQYLYVYALWLGIVAFVFPIIFGFN